MLSSQKLLNAGIVAEADLWRLGPGLVAVNPNRLAAVNAHLTLVGFGPNLEWMSRGYYVREVGINPSDFCNIFYRKSKVSSLPMSSQVITTSAIRRSAIDARTATRAEGASIQVEDWYDADASSMVVATANGLRISFDTRTYTTAREMASVFAGLINVGARSAQAFNGGLTGGGGMVGPSVPYIPSRSVPSAPSAGSPVKAAGRDWPLIDGPSVFTYGESINTSAIGLTYFFVNLSEIAEAIRAGSKRYAKDPTTLDILKRCDEMPNAGFMMVECGSTYINPLSLTPSTAMYAQELLDSIDLTSEFAPLKTKWGPGTRVVGSYGPDESNVSDSASYDEADSLAPLLNAIGADATVCLFVVDAAGDVTTPVLKDAHFTVIQYPSIAWALRARGITPIVAPSSTNDYPAVNHAASMNAATNGTMGSARGAVVTSEGSVSNFGHMVMSAIMTDQKDPSIKLGAGFITPTYYLNI